MFQLKIMLRSLGLANYVPQDNLTTFAYLDDKDISAIIGSELKDHPILLIPKSSRQKIIDEVLSNQPQALKITSKSLISAEATYLKTK